MVLGIGDGKIELVLDKQAYSPGETINGKLVLHLNSPKKAKGLRVKFYGERKTTHYSGRHHSHSVERIMEQEVSLDGEKEYQGGMREYPFQIKLPMLEKPKPPMQGSGIIEGVVNALASADPYSHVTWYLDASLNLPMSFDISRKQIVNLVR